MTAAFDYPKAAHSRRHGPNGYTEVSRFRPWLRDEFAFRCVYCLLRETWAALDAAFDLDHFQPTSKHPTRDLDYDNLLYACASCNSAKRDQEIDDPLQSLLRDTVRVRPDGVLETTSVAASRIIWQVGLNLPRYVRFREIWLELIRLAAEHKLELYRQLLGFPDDLPDLSKLRPPNGNARPEGVAESFFALRQRAELPETY